MPTLRSKSLGGGGVAESGRPPGVARAEPANPGSESRESARQRTHGHCQHLEATRNESRGPNAKNEFLDGCLTDPEPGMDSRRATVRNMRSKCRCSCILQFTFRRAVSCVLHRPPSQVIHCTLLYSFRFQCRETKRFDRKIVVSSSTSRRGEGLRNSEAGAEGP